MSQAVANANQSPTGIEIPVPVVSLRGLLPYWIFAGVVLMFAIYFVGAEEGATSIFSGMGVHEYVHDARHLLGFPCH